MIVLNIEQRSEAWHDIRAGRVTGTRFSELCAGENTDTYKKLVSNITCELLTGKVEETYTNAIMEEGIEKEPLGRLVYEETMEVKVIQAGFIMPDEDNIFHDWIGISPDGIVNDDGGIEIKCPLMRTHLNYIKSNKLPSEYKHQIQAQLYVTGRKWWDFVSFVEGMKLFVFRVYPDLELHEEFAKRLNKLLTDVKNELLIYNSYNIFDEAELKNDMK